MRSQGVGALDVDEADLATLETTGVELELVPDRLKGYADRKSLPVYAARLGGMRWGKVLAVEARQAVVLHWAQAGYSQQLIATGLGVSQKLISIDLEVSNFTNPERGGRPRGSGRTPQALIDEAAELVRRGATYSEAGAVVGVRDKTLRANPVVRAARLEADPEAHSTSSGNALNACGTGLPSAVEQIGLVEVHLGIALDNYRLNKRDWDRLRRILSEGVNRMEAGRRDQS